VAVKKRRDLLSDVITLARLIRTAADKRARAHGMTRAQWGILIRLEEQPGLLQKELADLLEVEPITVARLIDRLEARGMVERRPDPMDRRCWRLHLTDASRPLMSEIDTQLGELAGITTNSLDDSTLQNFHTALSTMREAITEDLAAEDGSRPIMQAPPFVT
jgi:DNA-binding MarR family transcriptional regulator